MKMRLRVRMYDTATDRGDFGDASHRGIEITLDPALEARIIQEEIWTQTAWSEGECPLAKVIVEGRRLEPGERVLSMLLPDEWEAVRRALSHMGDLIQEGVWHPPTGRVRALKDLPVLAAVLARMGGRPG